VQGGAVWFIRVIVVASAVSVTNRAIETRGGPVGGLATIGANVSVLMFLFLKNPYGELDSRRYLLTATVGG
jgi:hypothetical protein